MYCLNQFYESVNYVNPLIPLLRQIPLDEHN